MAFLEVKNIQKTFGTHKVLCGIDFTLEKGEVLSIIGSSGGGKTTLLRCLTFLETPDTGEVRIDGEPIVFYENGKEHLCVPDAQKKFGLVFQQFNLFPQYSVLDNLTLAPRLRDKSISREEVEEKAMRLLATVGLEDKANFYPWQISGGQQQRVAIARALMLEPDILFFDEPTSALDPELTGEVLRVIRDLKGSDRTMIIVTHEMGFARSVSDKIIFMAKGEIEEAGTPEEVFDRPQSEKLQAFLAKEEF